VSSVLLVTADHTVRSRVRRLAEQAGVHLIEYRDLHDAALVWDSTPLVLLGADLVAVAAGRAAVGASPSAGRLIVVSADRPRRGEAAAAAAVAATPVSLHFGPDRLRRLFGKHAAGTLDRLRTTACRVGFADRAAGRHRGYLTPDDITASRACSEQAVYVSVADHARSYCRIGQSSTVQRSNFHTLHHRFPGVWTDTVSGNVAVLGAFLCDLPSEAVGTLCALADYPVLDEQDLAALERGEIEASWEDWVYDSVYAQLGARCQAVWDAVGATLVERWWWDVVAGTDCWPQHTGYDVRWDLDRLVPAFGARLMAEFRRTWRPDPRYRISRIRPASARTPTYAIHVDAKRVGVAYSRFQAMALAWQHRQSPDATAG
jgi:hypothetical protein